MRRREKGARNSYAPGDIYWTNNLWYFDPKVKPYNQIDVTHRGSDALLANITVTGDVVVTTDPGFKDITSKTDPAAYDLVAGSIAIDKGTSDDSIVKFVTLDFLGRTRPSGAAYDLGAFELGAAATTTTGTGGVTGAGGSSPVTSTPGHGSGGVTGTGGSSPATSSPGNGTGGVTSAGGSAPATSAPGNGTGGSSPTTTTGAGGATPSNTATTGGSKEGCNCRVGQGAGVSRRWLGLVGLGLLALRRRRLIPDRHEARRQRIDNTPSFWSNSLGMASSSNPRAP